MDHADVMHVLDSCHPCEHYIIMYAYMIIIIYVIIVYSYMIIIIYVIIVYSYMIIIIYVYTDVLRAVCEWGNPWSKCCMHECYIQ